MELRNVLEQTKVLGICGREGAGKTTICNFLTETNQYEIREITDITPLDYIVNILFGFVKEDDNDPVWKLTREEQYGVIIGILEKYIDSQWVKKYNKTPFLAPIDCNTLNEEGTGGWTEFSFATALKKICSVIFNAPYKVLLAQTEEDRKLRDSTFYGKEFDSLGGNVGMSGRVLLEYVGTDVFRNNFDKDIWIKIVKRNANFLISQGGKVIFPDVRFENEIKTINELNGLLLLVYRKEEDLILTDYDKTTHPAKWHFLQYAHIANNLIKFHNCSSLESLEGIFQSFPNEKMKRKTKRKMQKLDTFTCYLEKNY